MLSFLVWSNDVYYEYSKRCLTPISKHEIFSKVFFSKTLSLQILLLRECLSNMQSSYFPRVVCRRSSISSRRSFPLSRENWIQKYLSDKRCSEWSRYRSVPAFFVPSAQKGAAYDRYWHTSRDTYLAVYSHRQSSQRRWMLLCSIAFTALPKVYPKLLPWDNTV